jgi:hypothetical protein
MEQIAKKIIIKNWKKIMNGEKSPKNHNFFFSFLKKFPSSKLRHPKKEKKRKRHSSLPIMNK